MNLEIKHLKLVIAITEEKSVTKAAERLFLTQSALSHQLIEIENRLGTKLFLRLKKKMVLTDAGHSLLLSARTILETLKKTETEIQNIADGSQGKLRISTECYTCYHWLPSLIKEFRISHPGIDIEIVADATRDPISALKRGKLDLAITATCDTGNKDIEYSFLFEDEMAVVMSNNHHLAQRKFLKPHDLENEHLIVYSDLLDSMVYRRILKPADVTPKRISKVQLTEAVIEMVQAEMGVGVLARWAVESHINSGAVKAVSLTRGGFKRCWYAARLKTDPVPKYIPRFIELIAETGKPVNL